jgi:uracil-DNA glycosylase family 4
MTLARSRESMARESMAEARTGAAAGARRAIMPDTPPPKAPADLLPLYEVDAPFHDLYLEIADCPRCVLAKTRTRTVPGSGPVTADLMFIGEGPGAREDEFGLPFIGAAGRFLDELLEGIGLSRAEVYITNVVKCRPPGNRDPQPAETAACEDYLARQIELIDPKVIATLGRFSMARWFPNDRISQIHGISRELDGRTIMPLYHPAAALRNGSLRPTMHADFARIRELLDGVPPASEPAPTAASEPAAAPPAAEAPPAPPATPPDQPSSQPSNAPGELVDYSEIPEPDPKPQERLL